MLLVGLHVLIACMATIKVSDCLTTMTHRSDLVLNELPNWARRSLFLWGLRKSVRCSGGPARRCTRRSNSSSSDGACRRGQIFRCMGDETCTSGSGEICHPSQPRDRLSLQRNEVHLITDYGCMTSLLLLRTIVTAAPRSKVYQYNSLLFSSLLFSSLLFSSLLFYKVLGRAWNLGLFFHFLAHGQEWITYFGS